MDAEDTTATGLRRRAASSPSIPKEEEIEAEKEKERDRDGRGDEEEEEGRREKKRDEKEVKDPTSSTASSSTSSEPRGITWGSAFVALLLLRHFSAKSNLLHDCDEVFNYWEPLHYILYRSGFQTWEYR